MPRVCASSRRSPRNDSLLRPRRFCRATPRAGPPACRRPSASTDRGGGGRTPPRTPSIAAGSVVAAPPTVAVTREVFFQLSSRRRRGGRWSCFLRSDAPPTVSLVASGPSRSHEGATEGEGGGRVAGEEGGGVFRRSAAPPRVARCSGPSRSHEGATAGEGGGAGLVLGVPASSRRRRGGRRSFSSVRVPAPRVARCSGPSRSISLVRWGDVTAIRFWPS